MEFEVSAKRVAPEVIMEELKRILRERGFKEVTCICEPSRRGPNIYEYKCGSEEVSVTFLADGGKVKIDCQADEETCKELIEEVKGIFERMEEEIK